MATIKVDRNKCIGCGSCPSICPSSFEMFEGKAREKRATVDKITCEKEAEESCPVQAITVTE
jgi:ferredoxin